MADNLGYTPGTGASIKTDQGSVSGGHMQVMKLAISTDGDETLIPATAANGIAADVTRVQGTVTVAGTVTVQDGSGSVSVDDNAGSLTVDDGGTSLTVDGTVAANQGTPATAANGWPVKLTDGTDMVGISTVGTAKALKVDVVSGATTSWRTAVSFTGGQTDIALHTPAGGKKAILEGLIITPTAAGKLLKIFDDSNAAENMLFQGAPPAGCIVLMPTKPWALSAVNRVLRYTSAADAAGEIVAWGYEE